jgi:hypothetical protein
MDRANTPDWDYYYEPDHGTPPLDPWCDPALIAPVAKRPAGWLRIGIAFVIAAVAALAVGLALTAGGTGSALSTVPADTYRMSATPDYVSFEHVYSAETNADPIVAGTPFAVSLSSTFVNLLCAKLQSGTPADDLVTRMTGIDGLSQNGAQTIVDAAHNLVCTGH